MLTESPRRPASLGGDFEEAMMGKPKVRFLCASFSG